MPIKHRTYQHFTVGSGVYKTPTDSSPVCIRIRLIGEESSFGDNNFNSGAIKVGLIELFVKDQYLEFFIVNDLKSTYDYSVGSNPGSAVIVEEVYENSPTLEWFIYGMAGNGR